MVGTRGNFDLVTWLDRIEGGGHQQEVLKCINPFRRLVIVKGPPCISFLHWSHRSKHMHHDICYGYRDVGECLAKFAVLVCNVQMQAKRTEFKNNAKNI